MKTKSETGELHKRVFPALKRAARAARKLAVETGTPFYVMEKGKIVNLNPAGKRRKPIKPTLR